MLSAILSSLKYIYYRNGEVNMATITILHYSTTSLLCEQVLLDPCVNSLNKSYVMLSINTVVKNKMLSKSLLTN